jgi:hypothetical protein
MLVFFKVEKCNFEHSSYFYSCRPSKSYLVIGNFLLFAIHISTFIYNSKLSTMFVSIIKGTYT